MEIFKDINGYEGLYQVSNFGNVKSANGIRSSHKNNSGYLCIDLYKNNKRKKYLIHKLVAEAFLDRIDGKDYIDHIDEDKNNNNSKNLRWCTHRENSIFRSSRMSNKSSKYTGIHWHILRKKWIASIRINGKKISLGSFSNEHEAHLKYESFKKSLCL